MYKIVGADQREYGPVTEEQVRGWITEGRANAQTIAKFGDGPWKPLSTFPEFAALFGELLTAPPPALPPGSSLGPYAGSFPRSTNGLAIAGLVCGILGLFCCGPVFSTIALVLALVALSQINQDPARYTGKGLAVAGIVLAVIGYLMFALLLFSGVMEGIFRNLPRPF